MISFHGDIDDLKRLVGDLELADDILNRATVSALNKTATTVRAWMVKKVREDYNIPAKRIRDSLYIHRAYYSKLTGSFKLESVIRGSGKHGIPLYLYSPTPKRVPSTRRVKYVRKPAGYTPKTGIKVMVTRGSRKIVEGAFIARMSSGHVGIFKRMEKGLGNWWDQSDGNRIKELYGPSALRLLDQDRYYEEFDDFTEETMDKNMAHEADFYLRRAGVLTGV